MKYLKNGFIVYDDHAMKQVRRINVKIYLSREVIMISVTVLRTQSSITEMAVQLFTKPLFNLGC